MSSVNPILITPYQNPDLDGSACAYAYAEYLSKSGQNVMAAVFGQPHREAQFVMNAFNINPFVDAEGYIQL